MFVRWGDPRGEGGGEVREEVENEEGEVRRRRRRKEVCKRDE